MKYKNTRSLSPSAQEALRMRAVQAALKADTQKEVCQYFAISRQSLNSWLKNIEKGDGKHLKPGKKAAPIAFA